MRIWQPCPECGEFPFRPFHVRVDHDVDIQNIDDLEEWAKGVREE